MKIYIVEGSTGEYSDRSEWVVCAFRSKEKAEELASKATLRAKELQGENWRYQSTEDRGINEFDLEMNMDYTGTDYYVIETELKS